jgi:multicomponent Na+:H+ antiporter subunit D
VAYFHEPRADRPPVGEAPLSMLIPTWVLIAATLYFGVSTSLSAGVARRAAESLLGGAP